MVFYWPGGTWILVWFCSYQTCLYTWYEFFPSYPSFIICCRRTDKFCSVCKDMFSQDATSNATDAQQTYRKIETQEYNSFYMELRMLAADARLLWAWASPYINLLFDINFIIFYKTQAVTSSFLWKTLTGSCWYMDYMQEPCMTATYHVNAGVAQ